LHRLGLEQVEHGRFAYVLALLQAADDDRHGELGPRGKRTGDAVLGLAAELPVPLVKVGAAVYVVLSSRLFILDFPKVTQGDRTISSLGLRLEPGARGRRIVGTQRLVSTPSRAPRPALAWLDIDFHLWHDRLHDKSVSPNSPGLHGCTHRSR
jgi:hypothetical protein